MKKHFQKLIMIVIVSVSWFGQAFAATMEVSGADSTNSVTLSWTAPADDGDVIESGPCAVYDLRYARDSITPLNWHLATPVVGEPVPTTPGSDQLMLVTGLTPGTRYYWGLKAADETYYLPEAVSNPDTVNWSELSNVVMKGTIHVAVSGGAYRAGTGYFNNDNIADLAIRDTITGDLWIALGNGRNQFFPVHGPGFQGSMFVSGWLPGVGPYQEFYDDFSGDGCDDVGLLDLSNGAWYVAFNQYNLNAPYFAEAPGLYAGNAWIQGGWGQHPYYAVVDDFSHDGFADVCVYHPTLGRLSVMYNWNNHFRPAPGTSAGGSWITNWNAAPRGTYIPFVGDVSGDGYPDVFAMQRSNGRWTGLYNYAIPYPPKFVVAKGKYSGYAWIASGWGQSPYVSFLNEYTGDSLKEVSCWHPLLGAIFITEKVGNEFRGKPGPYAGGAMLIGWKAGLGFIPLSADFSGDKFADYVQGDLVNGEWWMAFNWGNEFRVVNGAAGNGSVLRNWGIQSGGAAKVAAVDAPDTLQSGTAVPADIELNQNYPNPFNPSTTISFSLPEAAEVTLRVYNILGQEVALLVDRQTFAAGNHSVEWNAGGKATGVYIYHLETGTTSKSNKMLLLK